MNELELTGRARTHVVELERPRCVLHAEVVTSFLAMRDSAAETGIDLVAASSFRDFDRQVFLWNRKWRGEQPLLDRGGQSIDPASLDDARRVDTILCWSAIPGGSRHHWGSDVDVIDAAAVPDGYKVQLVPAEYAADGVFGKLGAWLGTNMARFGFYRPYASTGCGAGVEPWHLSYWPVSSAALEALSLPVLRAAVASSDMLGKAQVLERLPEIYTRFVLAVDRHSPDGTQSSSTVSRESGRMGRFRATGRSGT
jgi:LAS superfamily LD-carboxypeptidase LdcB